MARIAEYKQIDTQVVERTIYHEADEEREAWEEVVTEEIPVMGVVYRDSTPEEDEAMKPHTLEEVKAQKVAEIEAYDTSEAVNGFTYGGQTMWLDKATRVGLVNAIDCTMMIGEEQVTFGIQNVSVTLPCATAKQMMAALEVYALKCYNVTLAHKNAVMALETAEEVAAYDITAGYPEKLAF